MRNVHQAFEHGLLPGLAFAGLAVAHRRAVARTTCTGMPATSGCRRCRGYYGSASARADRRVERGRDRSQADVRQGHQRALLRHAHDEDQPVHLLVQTDVCQLDLRRRSTAIRARASVRRTSTRWCARRERAAAPADQRVELRALQDVRHHGSLPGHHLGAARRRRRPAVRRHVTTTPARARTGRPRACKRLQASAIGAHRVSARSGCAGPLVPLARRGPRASSTRCARRVAVPVMAFWHGRILPAHLLLPPPRHRRHHERELRRRVDRAHHRPVRLRHRARLDVTRAARAR